jgi:pyruvate formate-lyase activating enzyme-like uncharacterized protein
MAKRPVRVKGKKKAVVVPKREVYPCKVHGTGKCHTAYMRVEQSGNAEDGRSHYCPAAWKDVVEKRKEWRRALVQQQKEDYERRGEKTGLKGAVKKSASAKPRRVVVKK